MSKFDELFAVVGDDKTGETVRKVFVVRYGRNGGATAWNYYSEAREGHASGGGYDLTATALEEAVRRTYATPRFNGAQGFSSLVEHLAGHGVRLARLSELVWSMEVAK